jgi:hypothetical protein
MNPLDRLVEAIVSAHAATYTLNNSNYLFIPPRFLKPKTIMKIQVVYRNHLGIPGSSIVTLTASDYNLP